MKEFIEQKINEINSEIEIKNLIMRHNPNIKDEIYKTILDLEYICSYYSNLIKNYSNEEDFLDDCEKIFGFASKKFANHYLDIYKRHIIVEKNVYKCTLKTKQSTIINSEGIPTFLQSALYLFQTVENPSLVADLVACLGVCYGLKGLLNYDQMKQYLILFSSQIVILLLENKLETIFDKWNQMSTDSIIHMEVYLHVKGRQIDENSVESPIVKKKTHKHVRRI